jgi:27-O-demethylrifamycin SV methyltransferase
VTSADYDPAEHYDRVTAAWQLLLGDELHYGIFERGDETLPEATGNLTTRMIEAAQLAPGLDVLDVGCGSGTPACRLVADHGVRVVGITTSEVGVSTARARAAALGLPDARFEQRDGTHNEFPDASFDRVWALESSHLMRDREALIAECARVLRPGGRFVLCDLTRQREIPFQEVRDRRAEFLTLRTAFGDARMEPLEYYTRTAESFGLVVDRADDLTAQTLPTFEHWRANARAHREEAVAALGEDGLDAFVRGADILEAFWRDGTLGYGLFAASKPVG